MENKEDINLNNESKINFKVVLHHKRGRKSQKKINLIKKFIFQMILIIFLEKYKLVL